MDGHLLTVKEVGSLARLAEGEGVVATRGQVRFSQEMALAGSPSNRSTHRSGTMMALPMLRRRVLLPKVVVHMPAIVTEPELAALAETLVPTYSMLFFLATLRSTQLRLAPSSRSATALLLLISTSREGEATFWVTDLDFHTWIALIAEAVSEKTGLSETLGISTLFLSQEMDRITGGPGTLVLSLL